MSSELTLGLVFLASVMLATAALLWTRQLRHRRALVRALKGEPAPAPLASVSPQEQRSWLVRLGRRTGGKKSEDSRLKLKLAQAGWDSRTAPLTYSAIRLSLTISLPLLLAVLTLIANKPQTTVLLMAALGLLLARLLPPTVLIHRTAKRQKEIRKSLPDALDLLVVCVEAGIGLDAAILRVADELRITHPAFAQELRAVNQRVNAGIPRPDALREMVKRSGVDDLRTVVTTLVQSDRLGVSIGRVLRVAGDGLRTRRRQRAEREARKVPIRMLVPLILFVLPALMLVLLGPAGIHLARVVKSTM